MYHVDVSLNFYVQVPVACISSFILTFFKHFYMPVFFKLFSVFFSRRNLGVFLHNRVATLLCTSFTYFHLMQITCNLTVSSAS